MTTSSTRSPIKDLRIVDTVDGVFLAPNGDLITDHLAEFGSHSGPFVQLALDAVSAGDLVVDVGAHIGTYTVPLARRVGPLGRVIAIEANPAIHPLLEVNVSLNDLQHIATVLRYAAGSERGVASLAWRRKNTGAAQLRDEGTEHVEVDALDRLVSGEPTLIKIDTEGFELEVLRGARGIIERCRPSLLIEISAAQLAEHGNSPEEVSELLSAAGYRFLTHVGERNSTDRSYSLRELDDFSHGGDVFDVLAVQPDTAARLLKANSTSDQRQP